MLTSQEVSICIFRGGLVRRVFRAFLTPGMPEVLKPGGDAVAGGISRRSGTLDSVRKQDRLETQPAQWSVIGLKISGLDRHRSKQYH